MNILNAFQNDAIIPHSDPALLVEGPTISRTRKWLKRGGWVLFGTFCLCFFTFIKLPNDKIKFYFDGTLTTLMAKKGISFKASESKISFFLGVSYTLKDVILTLPPPATPSRIDKLVFSPSVLSLLLGRIGGNLSLYQGEGNLQVSFSFKDPKISFSYRAKLLDVGRSGLFTLATELQGGGILSGEGSLSGDLNIPNTLVGNIAIHLSKIGLDSQIISGITIPPLNISEGTLEVSLEKGKAVLKILKLGRPGNLADDLQGTVTGDLNLGKTWESSTFNLKEQFTLSENVMKSIVLLDAILGSGKRPDGSYAFTLTGPVSSPFHAPLEKLDP